MNRDVMNYIFIGTGAVVLLVLYLLFAFLPLEHRLQARRVQYIAAQKELASVQELVARYDEFMQRLQKLQLEMQALEERVPGQPRIPELLKDVTRVATECNIKDFQFAPQPKVQAQNYILQPVQVTVTCDYHSLGLFISRLAALPRLINTRDFQINGRDKTGTTDSIIAKMTLVTYVRQEQ